MLVNFDRNIQYEFNHILGSECYMKKTTFIREGVKVVRNSSIFVNK